MNITLSADAGLIRRSREYAKKHGTTLNGLVRDYLDRITGTPDLAEAADEFARLAHEHSGKAPKNYRFSREEAHRRPG